MSARQSQIEDQVPAIWVEAALKGLRAVGLKETRISFSPDGVIIVETEQGHTFKFEGDPWERLDKSAGTGRDSRVYVISAASGHVKIGIAVDVKKRLRGLQNAHAEALSVLIDFPGGRPLEQQLHKVLAKYRMKGEWFQRGPWLEALLAAVADGQKGAEITRAVRKARAA